MKSLFLILIQVFSIGITLSAQLNPKTNLDFENKVNNWLTENNVPAISIGIIEDGKIKYLHAFGELQKGIPAQVNSIFNIASMTKPVVTMLTLKLVQGGQWNLDEPLFHYWTDPDVANDPRSKKLTTRHVLCHQTGFINWRSGHPTKKLTFDFEPGTQFLYSGEGFEYLRKALENKFKKPLDKLLDSIIFKPIGMKNTQYWDKNIDMLRLAHCHDSKGNEYKTSYETGVGAANNLLSTAEDYCKFLIYVMNGAGLSKNLYDDMINPQVSIKEHLARGLGWVILKDLPNGEYGLEHGGSNSGIKTEAFILPKSKRGIVILTNGDNGMMVFNNVIRESIDIGEKVLNCMNGTITHKTVTVTSKILGRFAGNWMDSYGRNLTIVGGDSVLKFSGTGLPNVTLYPEAENKYFLKDFDVQFEFITDDSLILISSGKIDWTAKKIKHAPTVNLSSEQLEKYVGTYSRSDNNGIISIIKENDSLKLSGKDVPIMVLCPEGETRFFAERFGYQFEFIKDESNGEIKMNILGNGKVLLNAIKIK